VADEEDENSCSFKVARTSWGACAGVGQRAPEGRRRGTFLLGPEKKRQKKKKRGWKKKSPEGSVSEASTEGGGGRGTAKGGLDIAVR